MKRLLMLTLAAAGLAGCVAVPVAGPPGVYVAPFAVVRPHHDGHHGYTRFDRGDRREHRWR
ncbi:MAG: hypothetical protein HY661_07025 [Betaproteobacteria bacterium]|nr:hypothetical protein [Betaproteobacteria bacterium]